MAESDPEHNDIVLLDSGDVAFRIDTADVAVPALEAERLMLAGLCALGWEHDVEAGLAIDDQEPRAMPDILIRDNIERLRASGRRHRLDVLHRRTLAAPWRGEDEHQQRLDAQSVPATRRTPPPAPPPVPAPKEPTKRASKAAQRAAEILDQRLFEDPQEQLRYELRHAYLTSVPPSQRQTWPWPDTYVLMPRFLADVAIQSGQIKYAQIIAAIVDVLSGRMNDINSREPRMLRTGGGLNTAQVTRSFDGALAWRASVQRSTAAARRIMWWRRHDGVLELARLAVHDDIDIPER